MRSHSVHVHAAHELFLHAPTVRAHGVHCMFNISIDSNPSGYVNYLVVLIGSIYDVQVTNGQREASYLSAAVCRGSSLSLSKQ